MNLVAAGEGRLQATTGKLRLERIDRVGLFEDQFPGFTEVAADGYSRRQYMHDRLDVLSRIDRAMWNSYTSDLDEVRASARNVFAIAGAIVPSDHVALELSQHMPRAGKRQVIRRWIIDHPMFEALCAEVFSEAEFQHDPPFIALSQAIAIFHAVARRVKRTGRPFGGRCAHAWVAHGLTVAYATYRRGETQEIHPALERIGGGEDTLLFADEHGAVRMHIDEAQFACELSQLHVPRSAGWPSGACRDDSTA